MDIIDLLEKEIEADIKGEEDPERIRELGDLLREAIVGTELEKEVEELEKLILKQD